MVMETNDSVWKYYQKGFVDELYVPYLRSIVKDPMNNNVSINTWSNQGCSELVSEDLVRKDWGLRFQRMFDTDPCPLGWVSGPDGYCFREPLKHERVFYTNKAFIAKRQYWDGYGQPQPKAPSGSPISQETDLRSVNPYTGNYTVYYPGIDTKARVTYAKPIKSDLDQYDTSWSLPPQRSYQYLPTSDSYL
jgi:hypothetical protein